MRHGWRRWAVVFPGFLLVPVAPNKSTDDDDTFWIAAPAIGPKTIRIGEVATVYQDPSIDASHTIIGHTHTRELKITGSGFNHLVRPILEFDPPLDSAKLHVIVMSRSVMHLGLSSSQPEWMPAEKSGPLKIKGIDTGAGLVMFDPPVAVATVLGDSDAHERSVQDGVELPPLMPPPMPRQPAVLVEPKAPPFSALSHATFDGFSVLSHDTLDDFLQADCECAVVLFYDQPDGFMSPKYSAWRTLRNTYPTTKLGKIDMSRDANQPLGVQFGVDGYPTVIVFKNGLKARTFDFPGFPKNAGQRVNLHKFVGWAMHPPLPEPEGSAVFTLSEDTIEGFTLSKIAVVEFFARNNAESRTFSPAYTNASIELKSLDPTIRLGRIDVSQYQGTFRRFNLQRFGSPGFPFLVTFRNGVESSYYMGPPNAADIVEYVLAENPMEQPPPVQSENGTVSILEPFKTIGDFVQAGFAVVEFHVGTNGWGVHQQSSPEYIKASIELKRVDPTIKLGTMDMRGGHIWGSTATKFHVRGIPAIKIFRNGLLVSEYKGTRDAAEMVELIKAEKAKEVDTAIVLPPSVDASSEVVYMKATRTLHITGANFNLGNRMHKINKLYFDPPLSLDWGEAEVVSSTGLRLDNPDAYKFNENSPSWLAEPGPLKLVAIDTGAGMVRLKLDNGGVVVAVVKADVTVQDNRSLLIYPSTKQVHVTGSGFEDKIRIKVAPTGSDFTITDFRADHLTLNLVEDGVWCKFKQVPAPKTLSIRGIGINGDVLFRGAIATVLQDPSIGASDIEIYRTDTQQLVLRGNGFNKMARPILMFDPPLDSSKLHVNVESHTVMHLGLARSQPEWAPAGFVGPLKIKGIDTGAGMVLVDPAVAVANVLPDSKRATQEQHDVRLLRGNGGNR